jgi:hypothetical protein
MAKKAKILNEEEGSKMMNRGGQQRWKSHKKGKNWCHG